jgi:hypothetical protein
VDRFERWREVIHAASDEQAVEQAVREYAATIPPAIASLLPPECQRALVDHDIQRAAVTLLHCDLAFQGDASVAEIVRQVAQAYAAASQRIARLAQEPVGWRAS